jgi:DNA-binding MarR family transcriptional regulator
MSQNNNPGDASSPIREKWGDALEDGFVVVPTVLLRRQGALGLNSEEVLVLLNLFLYWRESGQMPYPGTAMLAKRMGIEVRTAQRRIASLERKGFIRRARGVQQLDGTQRFTRYDLSGIVEKLQELGAEAKMFRANRKEAFGQVPETTPA